VDDGITRIKAELKRWGKGVIKLADPVEDSDLDALSNGIQRPLPGEYVAILRMFDGADLRGDRMFSAMEALERWQTMRTLIAHSYRDDGDWQSSDPPDHLLPIGTDLEGNLKCLDLPTDGPEIVDWHRESGAFTTWHQDITRWFMTCLKTLAIRFDHKGRPRAIRAGDADGIHIKEMEAHLSEDPQGAFPRLELALFNQESGTPEDALFAFREASAGVPNAAMNHYLHARFAILHGHHEEARRQLRRALAVPQDRNPRKHEFRAAYLPAAHALLASLYETVGGQQKKADEHGRLSDRAAKRYGFDGYDESPEFNELLRAITRKH